MLKYCALLLLLVACGGDNGEDDAEGRKMSGGGSGSGTDLVCEPGRVTECPCLDGESGVQTCSSSGERWGACDCQGAAPPISDYSLDDYCSPRVIAVSECPEMGMIAKEWCAPLLLEMGTCTESSEDAYVCCIKD